MALAFATCLQATAGPQANGLLVMTSQQHHHEQKRCCLKKSLLNFQFDNF